MQVNIEQRGRKWKLTSDKAEFVIPHPYNNFLLTVIVAGKYFVH